MAAGILTEHQRTVRQYQSNLTRRLAQHARMFEANAKIVRLMDSDEQERMGEIAALRDEVAMLTEEVVRMRQEGQHGISEQAEMILRSQVDSLGGTPPNASGMEAESTPEPHIERNTDPVTA